jgi:hypothetical protein
MDSYTHILADGTGVQLVGEPMMRISTALLLSMLGGSALAADLPPHFVDLGYGTLTCERGYLLKQGECISFDDLPKGPQIEISELPSAGEGSRQPPAAWEDASALSGQASISGLLERTFESSPTWFVSIAPSAIHAPAAMHSRASTSTYHPAPSRPASIGGSRFTGSRR